MAPSSSSSPSSSMSPSSPAPLFTHQSPHFTPIQECEEGELQSEERKQTKRGTPVKHQPTPLHIKNGKPNSKKRHESCEEFEDGSVNCYKCRPHSRDKFSVVPLDNNGLNKHSSFAASPNGIFKSIFSSLTRKSPKSTDIPTAREEHWKIAVAELSHKLIQATRKRDEAILEASRLKNSMSELEKKLNKLEVYCHNLKSGLDECSSNSPYRTGTTKSFNLHHQHQQNSSSGVNDKVIEQFLISVSEARSSIRLLSRSLTLQLRHMGGRVFERISLLLQPYDIKISFSKNPKSVLFYLEALLNKALFEDFESVGFQKSSINPILNPIDRCEANYASFNVLKELTWEEVLNKGTRHFSEEFSKFCDRKMNEIVGMLGWNRAWPEPLLQAFFSAAKSVWLVHQLANSVHPGLPIFRVDKGVRFDTVYMEDMGGERAKKLIPTMVRMMVAPGFYVYGNVVKCKVLCRYYSDTISENKSLTLSP
ncbi:IRK-interacting protein [Euphorbia lathyris]|uniref:IRK-interacting protein n=1 Tax=Euphorbia lathyris TaxID=212925 RepID=UPI003313425B